MAVAAQNVAVAEPGAGEGPMLGPVDGKTTSTPGHACSPPDVEAAGRVEPEGESPGPPDFRRFPAVGHQMGAIAAADRVFGPGAVLVADLPPAFVLETDLPHEIAGEAGNAPAFVHIGVDGIAHLPGPVFIMAHEDEAGVALDQRRPEMQVGLRNDVDREA